jgi:hypothetical protein
VDPDGRTDIDHENKTIYADLNNRQDLEDAAGLLLGYQNHGYNVTAGDGNDNSMQFNNARGMNSFLEDNPGEIDISSLESVINIGGSAVTLGYLAQYAENGASAARGLGKVATGLNAVSILIDGAQFLQDPNLDTGSDLLFTAIGFAGTPGAAASLGLTYTKKGIVEGSKTLTNFSMGYEKFYINRWSQSLFGVNIK